MTIDETVQQAIRTDALYDETYRPQFHFTARANWLNDPNGLVYDQGEYHLFFQHNPTGIEWGNMTWGHATSRDLVHWEQLPNAIEPDPLGTIFSGSAVVDRHNSAGFQVGSRPPLVAIYTAAGDTSPESKGQPFTQCLAYSNDRGRTWTKYDGNPVLNHIVGGNRDPKVIWHAPTQRWIMALYLDGNEFGLFSSPDLKHWEPIQTLALPDCSECPDFFPLPVDGDKNHIKWVFTAANGHYLIGSFDGAKFTQEGGPFAADYGANYYAVQTYSDLPESDGRRIQVAWMAIPPPRGFGSTDGRSRRSRGSTPRCGPGAVWCCSRLRYRWNRALQRTSRLRSRPARTRWPICPASSGTSRWSSSFRATERGMN